MSWNAEALEWETDPLSSTSQSRVVGMRFLDPTWYIDNLELTLPVIEAEPKPTGERRSPVPVLKFYFTAGDTPRALSQDEVWHAGAPALPAPLQASASRRLSSIPPRLASLGVLGLAGLMGTAWIFASARLMKWSGAALLPSLVILAALALNRQVHIAATEGLETLAVCALVAASLAWVVKENREARDTAMPWFLAGMLGFVRADGFVWAAALVPAFVLLNGSRGPWFWQ